MIIFDSRKFRDAAIKVAVDAVTEIKKLAFISCQLLYLISHTVLKMTICTRLRLREPFHQEPHKTVIWAPRATDLRWIYEMSAVEDPLPKWEKSAT